MNLGAVSFGRSFSAKEGLPASLTRYSPGAIAPPHVHDHAYVAVCIAGSFLQRSRQENLASAGDLVVLPPGERHSDLVGVHGAVCLNLHLAPAAAEDLHHFAGALSTGARHVARELAHMLATGSAAEASNAGNLVDELVDTVRRRTEIARRSERVEQLVRQIESEPMHQWRLSECAEQVGLHPTHLARAFRQATGLSIGAFRRRCVMTRLCLDLAEGDRSLVELAQDYGFSDQPHMTRAVRLQTGISPRQFRRHQTR